MNLKPSLNEAADRLRIDGDLLSDLQSAIDQAHDEVLVFLGRPLYPDAAARTAAIAAAQAAFDAEEDEEVADQLAQDLSYVKSGIVVTHDIHAATLLLADRLVGNNTPDDAAKKEQAAQNILYKRKVWGL
jgi:hypothetical protein